MRTKLIYDLPLRIFHLLFALLFIAAFTIGKTIDDDSALFPYHMIAGLLLLVLIVMRIAWGMIGSKHSRFSNFVLAPRELLRYLKGLLSAAKPDFSGHNPASSWAAVIMMILAAALGVSGVLMLSSGGDSLKELHELLAYIFLFVVLLHLAGIIFHTIRHKDPIGLSMLDGRKNIARNEDSIAGPRPIAAGAFSVIFLAAVLYLNQNYDVPNRTLRIFGADLQLGGEESEHDHHSSDGRKEHHDRDGGKDDGDDDADDD